MTGVPTPLVGYRRLLMIGPRSHQRARARPRRILIVEDELVIALMIEEIVRETVASTILRPQTTLHAENSLNALVRSSSLGLASG